MSAQRGAEYYRAEQARTEARMQHVIRGAKGYVARSGSAHSYTRDISQARVYSSLASADADRCENERAIPLYRALDELRPRP